MIGLAKAFLLYSDETFSEEEINQWFKPVIDGYGIKIVYEIEDAFFSPLENPPISAGSWRGSKVVPINHRILARYPDILLKAFKKYPKNVIKKYLKAIYFSEEIDADGFKYGGTYDPFRRIAYLIDDGGQCENLAISIFIMNLVLYCYLAHSIFINPWMDQNPLAYSYLRDVYKTWEEIQQKIDISAEANEEDHKKGLCLYTVKRLYKMTSTNIQL